MPNGDNTYRLLHRKVDQCEWREVTAADGVMGEVGKGGSRCQLDDAVYAIHGMDQKGS
jgi:hypothetical protein